MKKTLVAILLASALVPATSFAQGTTTTTQDPAASSTTTAPAGGAAAPAAGMESGTMGSGSAAGGESVSAFIANDRPDVFQFSDLEGQTVYDRQGNSLGDISDVLMSRDGQIAAVLVGVGGFLGIGQKDVAVSVNKLDFNAAPPADTAANTGAMGTGATTGAGTTAMGTAGTATPGAAVDPGTTASTGTGDAGANEAPQRIVLDTTREQLESAPAWNETGSGAGSTASGGATTGTGTGTTGSSMAPAQ